MKKRVDRLKDHLAGPTGSIAMHTLLIVLLINFAGCPSARQEVVDGPDVLIRDDIPIPEFKPKPMPESKDAARDPTQITVQTPAPVPPTVTPPMIEPQVPTPPAVHIPTQASEQVAELKDLQIGPHFRTGLTREKREAEAKMPPGTQDSVVKALNWLKANQNPDGSWDKNQIAMTGLALLTFLAHGERQDSKNYGEAIQKAIQFLVAQQQENGYFGTYPPQGNASVYAHAIATYAISEARAITRIVSLNNVMEKAVEHIIRGQQTGGGWDYAYRKADRRDTSVIGWQVQALKAASISGAANPGLDAALKRAAQDMRGAYDPVGGRFHYTDSQGSMAMTGAGVLSLQFLKRGNSPEVRGGIKTLKKLRCRWKGHGQKAPLYGWYYITQAMFHHGGDAWTSWNGQFSQTLMEAQAEDGHWDFPEGGAAGGHEHGASEGPVYSTTLSALMLQVYGRTLPTFQEKAAEADPEPEEEVEENIIIS